MEDYWLPRREGGKATEVQTLPGAQNLSDLSDIEYFQNKLYQALGVPRQRIAPDNNFALGRTTEISREEILFSKFVQRLRNNFNDLFRQTLRLQLISKNIIKPNEWDEINPYIFYIYQHDNYFEELKRQEIFGEKLSQLQNIDPFKGTYFSREWIVKNVLQFSEDEWKQIKKDMEKEGDSEDDGIDYGEPSFNTQPKKKDPDAVEDGEESATEERE